MIAIIQIVTAFFGSLGFAMLNNIRGIKLLYAAIGGMLAWSVNLLLGQWLHNEVSQYFITAILITVYAEICARIKKTPTTTFLITGIIPLVPGSALYYSMSYAVNGLWDKFISNSIYTVTLAVALATGIMVASSLAMAWLRSLEYLGRGNPLAVRDKLKAKDF